MKDIILFVLSLLILGAFFIDAYLVLTDNIGSLDQNTLLLIGNVSGGVQTLAGVVVAFWFGSTKSSGEKDKTISNLTKPPT